MVFAGLPSLMSAFRHCQKVGAPITKVDPHDTSRRCYRCGHISEYSKLRKQYLTALDVRTLSTRALMHAAI